ncbi:flagellar biosynthesis protein FliQ [bacterium]|nr:flagellar biosynthesis protein FliQ [bacterium]
MTQEFAIFIVRETLFTALMIAAPMLLAGLIVGVTISLLQSVTQLQEMTLTFIPKILAVVTVLILFAPWMANVMLGYFHMILGYIGQMSQ